MMNKKLKNVLKKLKDNNFNHRSTENIESDIKYGCKYIEIFYSQNSIIFIDMKNDKLVLKTNGEYRLIDDNYMNIIKILYNIMCEYNDCEV